VTSRSHTALSRETLLFVRFSDDRWFFFLAVNLFVYFVLVIILINHTDPFCWEREIMTVSSIFSNRC